MPSHPSPHSSLPIFYFLGATLASLDKRALPIARGIAESGASVPLRMSALAAVGTLGDASDKPLLEKFASSSDIRLRKSAQGALGRLK